MDKYRGKTKEGKLLYGSGMNSYDEFEVIGDVHDNPELMPNGGKEK